MASSNETAGEYWLLDTDDLLYVYDGNDAVDGSGTDDLNGGGDDDLQGGDDGILPSDGGDGLINAGGADDVFLFGSGEGDAFITGIPEGGIEDTLVMNDTTFDFLAVAEGMEEPSNAGTDPGVDLGGGETVTICGQCEIQLLPADFVL